MFDFLKKKETYTIPVVEEPVAPEPEIPVPDTTPRTLIGAEVKFTGNIEATEDLEVRGSITGNIKSSKKIVVQPGGNVKGDIKAHTLIVEGKTEGVQHIEDLCRISSSGCHHGELYVSTLVTEDGSEFEGTLHLKKKIISFASPAREPKTQTEEENSAL